MKKENIQKRLNQIKNIRNPTNKLIVLDEYVNEIIADLVNNSGCNAIIENFPKATINTVFNTFIPYGPLFDLHKYKGTVYLWFFHNEDAIELKNSVDQMECEGNILSVNQKDASLIRTKYNWADGVNYHSYEYKGYSLKIEEIDFQWKKMLKKYND